ncbi:Hypothetical protein NTJ_04107 [Nesidiocoris tenuis]|uniref:Uncharacterized protein n=1 Tax=Nesidiocoris tenuis TaxID=355587 RepID=A0ABN7AGE4_9HEMI|nr:Hypothetical protein NTJ_04107 [Nesidiocoris tenuis]
MISIAKALQAAVIVTPLLGIIHGTNMGRNMQELRNNMANFEWSRDGHYNANELAAVDPLAVLIRSHPWVFYGGRGKSTFSREGRDPGRFQTRVGRDEEIQFTETSRSPPFAPRLGRGYHYSARFRRVPTALN